MAFYFSGSGSVHADSWIFDDDVIKHCHLEDRVQDSDVMFDGSWSQTVVGPFGDQFLNVRAMDCDELTIWPGN